MPAKAFACICVTIFCTLYGSGVLAQGRERCSAAQKHYLLMENQKNIQSANFDLVNTYFGIDVGHTYDGIDGTV